MQTTATNRAVVWGFLALAALGNFAGYAFDLYQRIWWFDKVIHAYTTFAVTLLVALFLYGRVLTGARDHRFLLVLVIAGFGLGFGTLWEFAEWGYDRAVPTDAIKGKLDTITDLIVDTGGALVAGWVAARIAEASAREGDS